MKTTSSVRQTKSGSYLAVLATLILGGLVLAGCGSKLSGVYEGDALIEKLNFTSGNKVEITRRMGATQEATYVVEGKKVKITINGQTTILTIGEDGVLDGGGMAGKFRKQ